MKIGEFIKKTCEEKNVGVNVELCVKYLVNPTWDTDHDLTQEEMEAISLFVDRFCDGLTNLVRNASSTALSILRQKVDYADQFESINVACKWLWKKSMKDVK